MFTYSRIFSIPLFLVLSATSISNEYVLLPHENEIRLIVKRNSKDVIDYPSWSPDMRYIAFCKNFDIYIMDAVTKDVKRLTSYYVRGQSESASRQPQWLSSNELLFLSGEKDVVLKMKNIQDMREEIVLKEKYLYSYYLSPDKNLIILCFGAESKKESTWLYSMKTRKWEQVIFPNKYWTAIYCSWLPDSNRFIYKTTFKGGECGGCEICCEDENTNNPACADKFFMYDIASKKHTELFNSLDASITEPSTSPDGRWVAYYKFYQYRLTKMPTELWILNLNSKYAFFITEAESSAAWSSDSKSILYIKNGDLYLGNLIVKK